MFAKEITSKITSKIINMVSGHKVSEPVYQEIDLSVYGADYGLLWDEFMAAGKFELAADVTFIYEWEQTEKAAAEINRVHEFNRVQNEIAYSRAIELELSASNWY